MSKTDIVAELSKRKMSQVEIARELGMSTRQVRRHQRAAGIEGQVHVHLTDEQREEIRRLSEDEQWPPEEIAATLDIPYTTVRDHSVPGAGIIWRDTAGILARKHNRLFSELRRGLDRKEAA